MLKLVVTDDVLYINDGAIILSKWVCDSHHEKIIVRDAFGFPMAESKMPVETQEGEREDASDVIKDIGANWKGGAGFGDYYQWIVQGKDTDIVSTDTGYAYENYGVGGVPVRTDILNTQVATVDLTTILRSDYNLETLGITIVDTIGTAVFEIDGTDITVTTAGTVESLELSNGETFWFQESNGVMCYGSEGVEYATYTSVQSGDWDDPATWGEALLVPDSDNDLVVISAQHTVTIPTGLTVTCGLISQGTGTALNLTTLDINGRLNMAGNLTRLGYSKLKLGAGGVLDLNGHTIASSVNYTYNEFKGTALNKCTVQSTGSEGVFTNGANALISDFDYCDIIGLEDSTFGRTHNIGALVLSYKNSTFTNCGRINLEALGAGTNSGFTLSNCDFRNPSSATPITSNKYYPYIYQYGTKGSNDRVISNNTWETNGTQQNYAQIRLKDATINNNIFMNVKFTLVDIGFNMNFESNYWDGNIEGYFITDTNRLEILKNNYLYNRFGDHPLGYGVTSREVIGNIHETPNLTNKGCNWHLYNNDVGKIINIKNNIFLGTGAALTFVGNASPILDISRNTYLLNNGGYPGVGLALGTILLTELVATNLGGTTEIYNNLSLIPDTTITNRDVDVELIGATADQVDYLDFNVGFGYTGGVQTPPLNYGANVNVTAGKGVNDFSLDPQLVDKDRNLLKWAQSLGKTTVDEAVAEMLKLNQSDYVSTFNVTDLIAYVKEGFRPQNAALTGSGRAGANIGAIDV